MNDPSPINAGTAAGMGANFSAAFAMLAGASPEWLPIVAMVLGFALPLVQTWMKTHSRVAVLDQALEQAVRKVRRLERKLGLEPDSDDEIPTTNHPAEPSDN